eukprot:scaffold82394_cov63-Phaeocystis_antarctica.AAC.2
MARQTDRQRNARPKPRTTILRAAGAARRVRPREHGPAQLRRVHQDDVAGLDGRGLHGAGHERAGACGSGDRGPMNRRGRELGRCMVTIHQWHFLSEASV